MQVNDVGAPDREFVVQTSDFDIIRSKLIDCD